jgi:glycine cleavage system transcriptional repressor
VLSVHGADHPGIVSALTAVVAGHGGNITDLTTRLAGDLYVVVADIDLRDLADVPALDADIRIVADELGVDAVLRPADPDVL